MSTVTLLGNETLVGLHLSQHLHQKKGVTLQAFSSRDLDPMDPKALRNALRKQDILINTLEVSDLDEAEKDRKSTFAMNADIPRHLAYQCEALDVRLVQVSSAYVFDGSKEAMYVERDIPNPINLYGSSKFVAEKEVRGMCSNYLILRLGAIFGSLRQSGHLMYDIMDRIKQGEKEIRVLDDQLIAPAFAADLCPAMVELILSERTALAHVGPNETCTWYEYAQAVLTHLDVDPLRIQPCPAKSLDLPAARPLNLVLDPKWSERWTGQPVPGWREGLRNAFS